MSLFTATSFWNIQPVDVVVSGAPIEYLIVGGGASAGGYQYHPGGGGAGGFRTNLTGFNNGGGASPDSAFTATLGTAYTVTIGAGGAQPPAQQTGSNGSPSTFSTFTSVGGGGGGNFITTKAGRNGGAGGGAAAADNTFSAGGTGSLGYNGGQFPNGVSGLKKAAGGGGGAGQAGRLGGLNTTTNGYGGSGSMNPISQSGVFYAGGGGGSVGEQAGTTLGGPGGGGNGNNNATAGNNNGAANTGGGGGGGERAGTSTGIGGSGIIIFKVSNLYTASFTGGVTVLTQTSGSSKVYKVTAAGAADTVTFTAI